MNSSDISYVAGQTNLDMNLLAHSIGKMNNSSYQNIKNTTIGPGQYYKELDWIDKSKIQTKKQLYVSTHSLAEVKFNLEQKYS